MEGISCVGNGITAFCMGSSNAGLMLERALIGLRDDNPGLKLRIDHWLLAPIDSDDSRFEEGSRPTVIGVGAREFVRSCSASP